MSYGPNAVFATSAASGATSTTAVDLGRSWGRVGVNVPASTSFDIVINGSDSLDGTYKRITSATIASSVSNTIVVFSVVPTRFVKLEQTTAAANTGYAYKLHCAD